MRTRFLVPLGVGAFALATAVALYPLTLRGQTPSGTQSFHPTTTNTDAAIKAAADAAKAAAAARASWSAPGPRGAIRTFAGIG